MDQVPRLAHDELLRRVEGPQEAALRADVAGLEHGAAIAIASGRPRLPGMPKPPNDTTEATPLLMAGTHVVTFSESTQDPVHLKALAARLSEDEHRVIDADHRTPTWTILREEAPMLASMAVPMMFVATIEVVPETFLDMMIGRSTPDPTQSTRILAAFSLAGIFRILLIAGLVNGLGAALDTLCSQAFGGRRLREFWLFAQTGALAYALGCVPVGIIMLNGGAVLRALGQKPAITGIASEVLVVYFLCVPLACAFSVMKSALQAQNVVTPVVLSISGSWAVALLVAFYLGFHTSLGYMGIALANLVINGLKAVTLLPIVLRTKAFTDAWPGWRLGEAARLLPRLARLGLSGILMVTFQMLGITFISVLAGLLPNAEVMIAANSIFVAVLVLSMMPLMGVCIAGAVRMGNALGAGQARRAAIISRLVLITIALVGVLGAVLTASIARPYAKTFTTNTRALEQVDRLSRLFAPLIPVLGLTFGFQSIFRACGRQWLCALVNVGCISIVGGALGVVLALSLSIGLDGLWIGHFLGMGCFLVVSAVWVARMDWDAMAHEARRNTHLHVVDDEPEPTMSRYSTEASTSSAG